MKIADTIDNKLNRLSKGYIFTYADFIEEVNKKEGVIKALNRMAESGRIVKLSKGKYYKPEATIFGGLEPNQSQVVKDLLENDGKITGYLTGLSIYNTLGLTTQVSNTIQIGKNDVRPLLKRGRYTISFIKQKNTITKENIPLLQILDAIRYIKKIPDASLEFSCKRLSTIINNLSLNDKNIAVRLALKYPAATKALLGALLETKSNSKLIEPLRKTLNPITIYKFGKINNTLPNAENWNIK